MWAHCMVEGSWLQSGEFFSSQWKSACIGAPGITGVSIGKPECNVGSFFAEGELTPRQYLFRPMRKQLNPDGILAP